MNDLEQILTQAFTKVAQKACRNGEAGTRVWPPLADLPAPESWEMVGRQYAREVAADILDHCFKQPGIALGLLRFALRVRRR